jgi:hypothetical protein
VLCRPPSRNTIRHSSRNDPATEIGDFVRSGCARLPSRRSADAGGAAEDWAQPCGEDPRSQNAAAVSELRQEGAGGGFDEVAGAGATVKAVANDKAAR